MEVPAFLILQVGRLDEEKGTFMSVKYSQTIDRIAKLQSCKD